jgi:hypothetical protein
MWLADTKNASNLKDIISRCSVTDDLLTDDAILDVFLHIGSFSDRTLLRLESHLLVAATSRHEDVDVVRPV